jgi:signal transduction histidine kinase
VCITFVARQDRLRQAELSSFERDQLILIHRNALTLYKLATTLLDFSRLEAGRARASFERIPLASFTADLVSIFRSAAERYALLCCGVVSPSSPYLVVSVVCMFLTPRTIQIRARVGSGV